MKISFYKRKKTIYANVSAGSESFRVSTGLKVEPHMKFSKRFIGTTTEVAALNNELDRFKVKITEKYLLNADLRSVEFNAPLDTNDSEFLLHNLMMKYIQMMLTGEVKSSSKRNYSLSTVNIYKYCAQLIDEFSDFYGPLDLSESHIDGNLSVPEKIVISDYFNEYFKRFEKYLIDRGSSISSRSDILNITGVMVNYWAKKYFFQLPKVPRLQADKKPIIVFPPAFVKKFLNDLDKYNKLEHELKMVWEVSATILITTLRIADVMSLTPNDLVISKDDVYLNKKNQKTGVFSQMPLPRFLGNIYRENLARYGRIFTMEPSKEVVYYNIKKLFRLYEDAHDVVTISRLDNTGNQYYETKPLWEWVHPHLLRKTAITTMLYNGVPERYIKFCSGHEARSLAFEHYVGHVEKNFKNEVSNYYDSFLNA
jgi:integrase